MQGIFLVLLFLILILFLILLMLLILLVDLREGERVREGFD